MWLFSQPLIVPMCIGKTSLKETTKKTVYSWELGNFAAAWWDSGIHSMLTSLTFAVLLATVGNAIAGASAGAAPAPETPVVLSGTGMGTTANAAGGGGRGVTKRGLLAQGQTLNTKAGGSPTPTGSIRGRIRRADLAGLTVPSGNIADQAEAARSTELDSGSPSISFYSTKKKRGTERKRQSLPARTAGSDFGETTESFGPPKTAAMSDSDGNVTTTVLPVRLTFIAKAIN